MTAKEYLEQIQDIDALIKSVCDDIEGKEERAMRITSAIRAYSMPAHNKQRMADVIDEYIDIERGELRKLTRKRQEIINTMKLLPSKEYGILFRRYVLGCEYHEIGTAYDRSESWAKSMTRKALDILQEILDER